MNGKTLLDRLKNKKGTVTVVVALLLIVLIGFAALGIDVGHMMVTRNELQNVADASALAATSQLSSIYSSPAYTSLSYSAREYYAYGHKDEIVANVTEMTGMAAVKVAGQSISISSADIILGLWDPDAKTFTTTPQPITPNAVRVFARRDGAANGPVLTFLAGVVGIGSFSASAMATAALTGLPSVPEGGLPIPVGISKAWFSDPAVYCTNPIVLYPTNVASGCAGWHVYDQSPSSASTLRNTIDSLNDGTYVSPETTTGVTQFDFTNGNVANALVNLTTLFDTMRVKNDGVLDQDTDSSTWTATVPVYDLPDCSAPNGTLTIVGLSTVVISAVTSPPAPQQITAQVVCDKIVNSPGGGPNAGTLGGIPNLVQ